MSITKFTLVDSPEKLRPKTPGFSIVFSQVKTPVPHKDHNQDEMQTKLAFTKRVQRLIFSLNSDHLCVVLFLLLFRQTGKFNSLITQKRIQNCIQMQKSPVQSRPVFSTVFFVVGKKYAVDKLYHKTKVDRDIVMHFLHNRQQNKHLFCLTNIVLTYLQ